MIEGFSPNGDAMFALAHNWLSFMEAQYGTYRPGAAMVEPLVLPDLPRTVPGLREIRAVYRSPGKRTLLPSPAGGMSIRTDRGTLGLAGYSATGRPVADSAMGETLYIPVPGTPGLWRLRLFVASVAPAEGDRQAAVSAIQRRVFETLTVSDQFVALWRRGFGHSVEIFQEYSRSMGRVFDRYLSSAARSTSAGGDLLDGWAEMMRGGHYERDQGTGEDHWVSNNQKYWWKNDRGELFGNDTGAPPLAQGNVRVLTRP